MRRLPHLLVATALAAVLAGCGSDDGQSPGAGGAAGAEEPSDEDVGAGTPGASPPLVDPAEPTGLAAPADDTWVPWSTSSAATDLRDQEAPGFRTAAGDVTCVYAPLGSVADETTVLCERSEGLGVDAPRPVDCDGDWGDVATATAPGGGELVCADDAVAEALRQQPTTVLADGDAVTLDGLTCAARAGAVQCLDDDARGLVVSARVIVVR